MKKRMLTLVAALICMMTVVSFLMPAAANAAALTGEPSAIGMAECRAKSYINLRKGPGTSYKKTGKFPAKAQAEIYVQSGDWYKIYYNGAYHWASGSYLNVTEYNVMGAETSGESVSTRIGTAVCRAKTFMNLRSGPSSFSRKAGTLKAMAVVGVYEKNGAWYKVRVNGQYYWAHGAYLKVTTMNSTAPAQGTSGAGETGSAGAPAGEIGTAVCTAKQFMNLRGGAGTSYRKTATLKAKEVVNVYEKSGKWYKIYYNGKYHWAHESYLSYTAKAPENEKPADKYAAFPVPANNKLAGKVVILDPGHGTRAGGAYADYTEHIYNLKHAMLIKQSLENSGAKVIMTRTTDDNVENYARVSMANKYTLECICADRQSKYDADPSNTALLDEIAELDRLIGIMQSVIDDPELSRTYYLSPYETAVGRAIHPDLKKIFEYQKEIDNVIYVSIHSNAPGGTNTSVNGTVTYYMDNQYNKEYYTGYPEAKSKKLATAFYDEVTAAGGYKKRAVSVNDYFMVREVGIPAALIEIGFHTNESDRKKLMDEATQKRVANGITYAIMDYFA